jgi:hypothetical protein
VNDQRSAFNIWWLALTAVLEGLQIMVIVIAAARFFPIPTPAFVNDLFPVNLNDVRPEREIFFYQIFVASSLLIALSMVFIWRGRLQEARLGERLRTFSLWIGAGLALELFAAFKWITSPALAWPQFLFYAALAAALLGQIFYVELKACGRWFYTLAGRGQGRQLMGMDAAVLLIAAAALYTPDMTRVLARDFAVDQFYHFDGFIMSSAWAWLKGCVLNVDVISQYSILLPSMMGTMARWMGGLTYAHADEILMAATAVYLLMAYAFMRYWLKDVFIAAFGLFFFMKWHLFHWGVSPIIWMLPGVIPVRYLFDVVILGLILKDLERPALVWRLMAALVCGLAMAYMLDTGVYITAAFGAYLFLTILLDRQSNRLRPYLEAAGLLALSAGLWLFLWYLSVGPWLGTKTFWHNVTEHIALFLDGWGALPVTDGLRERNFFAFVMGLTIPLVYTASAMVTVALVFLKKVSRTWLITAVIALYGLMLYHYFICRSAVSSYYVVCLPFVLVLCFWLNEIRIRLKPSVRPAAGAGLLLFALGALLTNNLFAYYPNALNLSGYDWRPETEFYQKEFHFSEDVALVRRLTRPDEPTALISSFETEILIEADRKPFFYYFPLITSRFMSAQFIGGTYLHTKDRMDKTLRQMEDRRPEHVFVEKRLFNHTLPEQFYQHFQTISLLMDYLHAHYTVDEQGQYLLALRRR